MRRSVAVGAGLFGADGVAGLAAGGAGLATGGAGLATGGAGSAAFLMGSAGFPGAGAAARPGAGADGERSGCPFGDTGRAGAAARAGITGAMGLPAGGGSDSKAL